MLYVYMCVCDAIVAIDFHITTQQTKNEYI